MPIYSGIFTNKAGTFSVEVHNDFTSFSMDIGSFKFRGSDLYSFELENPDDFLDQDLIDFDIIKYKSWLHEIISLCQKQSRQVPHGPKY